MNGAALYSVLRPLLVSIDTETAQDIVTRILKTFPPRPEPAPQDPALRVTLWNRHIPNPIGLAAGFDRNAALTAQILHLGYGFVETGPITPRPQTGAPRPRLLRDDHARIITDRAGCPNDGMNACKTNLENFLDIRPRPSGMVGLHLAANTGQKDTVRDYRLLVHTLGVLADYIALGIPDQIDDKSLSDLIARVREERQRACGREMPPPLLLRIPQECEDQRIVSLSRCAQDAGIDGLIIPTTRSAAPVRHVHDETGGKIPLIAVDGVMTGRDAYDRLRAGASLVQLYSALAFDGPGVVKRIKQELSGLLRADGIDRVETVIGTGK